MTNGPDSRTRRKFLAVTGAAALTGLLLGAISLLGPALPEFLCPGGLWTPLVLGGLSACGAGLILAAGRVEGQGQRRRASRRVDTAGRLMFLACATYAVVLFGATVLSSADVRAEQLPDLWSPVWLVVSATSMGLAGFIGLLAGLTRKPRPSGTFATLLYGLSQWALMAALGI